MQAPCRVQSRIRGTVVITSASNGPDIKLIASDVDGTLLDSKQRLSPKVEKAVKLSRSLGIPVSIYIPLCIHEHPLIQKTLK